MEAGLIINVYQWFLNRLEEATGGSESASYMYGVEYRVNGSPVWL